MRTLIVGSGLVGRAVAGTLVRAGDEAVLASRTPGAGLPAPWTAMDATDRAACARVVGAVRPDAVVLVHGPSDVTWCEEHPVRAARAHTAVAANLGATAGDRRMVLISTDNVFDGTAPVNDEAAPARPANAYGAAKLAAERKVLALVPDATVLRVSLVYGWAPAGTGSWLNFFAACVDRLRRGEPVVVPHDTWTTPVLVDDAAAVTAAVTRGPAPRLLHLGGPDRISRAGWAEMLAEALGAPADLVVPAPRARTRYASRPVNSCLSSRLLAATPATAGIRVRGVREGIRALLSQPATRQGSVA